MSLKPMRVVLISPKGPLYRHRGGIFGKSLRYKPLTLTTLAALVPGELNVELTLIDEGIEDVPEGLEADLVGMTVITGTSKRAYELSEGFRRRGMKVVLGGPHVTLVPEDAQPHADAIVVGYAEETWPELLRDFARGEMKRRYEQGADLVLGGRPFAKRELLPKARFLTDNVFEATRGCVHDCDFCVVPSAWGRKPLRRPIPEVVREIEEHLSRRKGPRQILFVDLNLIASRSHAAELFTALTPLKVRWFGLSTVLIGKDDGLLELAEKSGCKGLLIGLESISPGNLALTRKGFNQPEEYAGLIAKLHGHGIAVQGCFTFGMDEDDESVFERTARFAVEAKIDLPRFAVVTPFPGTALYRRLESEGRILTRDWSLYDAQHVVFQPKRMSVEQLQKGTERAWRIAYGWGAMARRMMASPAPMLVRVATNLGYRFYAKNLHRFYHCDWMIESAKLPMLPTIPLTVGGAAR